MELINMLKKTKYVFTKEYREEVEYYEFLENVKPYIKLKGSREGIDDKVKCLANAGYISNCSISTEIPKIKKKVPKNKK